MLHVVISLDDSRTYSYLGVPRIRRGPRVDGPALGTDAQANSDVKLLDQYSQCELRC